MKPILENFSIKKLFGEESFDWKINAFPDEYVSFISGINGTGKTTILKLMEAFGEGNWLPILNTTFNEISLKFDVGTIVVLRSSDSDDDDVMRWKLKVTGDIPTSESDDETVDQKVDRYIEDGLVKELFCGHWAIVDSEYNHVETKEQVVNYIETNSDQVEIELPTARFLRAWNVKLVPSNRLAITVRTGHQSATYTSSQYEFWERIGTGIQSQLSLLRREANNRANMAESEVVKSMLLAEPSKDIDISDVQKIIDETQNLKSELSRHQLDIESIGDDIGLEKISPQRLPEAKMYYQSALDRIKSYEALNDIVLGFERFINTSFTGILFGISSDGSFQIEREGEEGGRIAIEDLSSGQHQIIMLGYYLYFKMPRECLVLIDEPEISMHQSWKASFAGELEDLAENYVGNRYLIATHSSMILQGRDEVNNVLDVRQ